MIPIINLRQRAVFLIMAIAMITGCQQAPVATPTPTSSVTATPTTAAAAPEGILERVKARGKLICGVNGKLQGFSYVDEKGVWSGLDVDYCQAIAAAVLGDAKAVEFKPLLAKDRFSALQSGEIDILMRNTTRTLTREVTPNIAFAPTTFFDGQGIMLRIGAPPSAAKSPSPTSTASSTATPTASASPTSKPETEASNNQASKSEKTGSTPKTSEELAIALKE